jgi:hypothetical protein
MTPARERELIAAVAKITHREELDGFRAQLRLQDEVPTPDLFRAMEARAATFRRLP